MKQDKPAIAPLIGWTHATTEIPAQGLARTRSASEQERAQITQALGLAALERLEATYRIVAIAGGGWRLAGTLSADVVQSCVVSLEPVPSKVDAEFAVEFWRDLEEPEGGEDKSVLEGADVEALEGDAIPSGRIVFEALSGALDPYPRKQDAAFEWQEKPAAGEEKSNPFSVLARMKDKS